MQSKVNLKDLESTFSSKYGLFHFLRGDCEMYLPPIGQTTTYFLADLFRGKKKVSLHDLNS